MNLLAADVANYLSEDIVQGKLLAFQTKLQNEQVDPYDISTFKLNLH